MLLPLFIWLTKKFLEEDLQGDWNGFNGTNIKILGDLILEIYYLRITTYFILHYTVESNNFLQNIPFGLCVRSLLVFHSFYWNLIILKFLRSIFSFQKVLWAYIPCIVQIWAWVRKYIISFAHSHYVWFSYQFSCSFFQHPFIHSFFGFRKSL